MSEDLERRVSTRVAAGFLGCSRRHVHGLIRAGLLEGWDVSLAGSIRPRWVVTVSSLRSFLEARHKKKRTEGTEHTETVRAAGPRATPEGE